MLTSSIFLRPILTWFLASALFLALVRVIYALYLSPYRHIPGPRLCKITRYWVIYHDTRLRRTQKIHDWHRQYGDVVLIAPGEVSFSNVAATRETYSCLRGHPKSRFFDNFVAFDERSIFSTLDVKEHRQILKRTFAFYQPSVIHKSTMLQPVRTNVRKLLDRLAKETEMHITIDVLRYCNFFAFDNITRLLYGSELCANTIEDETCVERKILAGWMDVEVWNNFSYNFPFVHKTVRAIVSCCTQNPDFLAAEDILTNWSMAKVDTATRQPEKMAVGSLLHQLHNTKASDGESLSKTWIAAELLDNIHAAQSTVALALTYVLWDLACSPQWQKRIRDELAALPVEKDGLPSFDDIRAAPILDACITESGRLHPLSSGRAERVVPATKLYDGVSLPAGTIVSTSTLSIHHRPGVFPNPQEYRPERWLEADEATLRVMKSCYMPFGYGARLCVGKSFALAEIKLLISGVVMECEPCVDVRSGTTAWSMEQLGTQNALPRGRRCDLSLRKLRLPDISRRRGNQERAKHRQHNRNISLLHGSLLRRALRVFNDRLLHGFFT